MGKRRRDCRAAVNAGSREMGGGPHVSTRRGTCGHHDGWRVDEDKRARGRHCKPPTTTLKQSAVGRESEKLSPRRAGGPGVEEKLVRVINVCAASVEKEENEGKRENTKAHKPTNAWREGREGR